MHCYFPEIKVYIYFIQLGLYLIYCTVAFPLNRVDKIIFCNIILLVTEYSFLWIYYDLFNQFPLIGFFTFLLAKISIALLGNYHTQYYKTFKKSDGNIFSYLRSTQKDIKLSGFDFSLVSWWHVSNICGKEFCPNWR